MGKTYYSHKEFSEPANCFPSAEKFNMYTSAEILEMNASIFDEIPTKREYWAISSTSFQQVVWGMKEEPKITIVKMDDGDIKDEYILESHRRRPFIVIRDNQFQKTVQGFYLTSNLRDRNFKKGNERYKKIIEHEKLNKMSLVCHNEFVELPYHHIFKDLGKINNWKDINQLTKVNALLKRYHIYSDERQDMIERGDMIQWENDTYIIYQINNSFVNLVRVEKIEDTNVDVENDSHYFYLYNQVYQIFHEECIHLPLDYNFFIVGILQHQELQMFLEKRVQYFYEKELGKAKKLYVSFYSKNSYT